MAVCILCTCVQSKVYCTVSRAEVINGLNAVLIDRQSHQIFGRHSDPKNKSRQLPPLVSYWLRLWGQGRLRVMHTVNVRAILRVRVMDSICCNLLSICVDGK